MVREFENRRSSLRPAPFAFRNQEGGHWRAQGASLPSRNVLNSVHFIPPPPPPCSSVDVALGCRKARLPGKMSGSKKVARTGMGTSVCGPT